jgi:2-methylcitrate dehydratase
MSLAHKIARFACHLTYDDLPQETIHEVKRRFIDTIGCALGAWLAEPPKIAREVAYLANSKLGATVIGTRHKSTPELAAFANGTMFRYLDYNDTYLSKEPGHPSDNIAALLSVAEAFDLTGEDLIKGIVVSYEVQCRLCDAYSIRKRGWDHVTYGSFSTVAGCGAMLDFDEEQMVHALGLAGVPNNAMRQTRVGQLCMWKGCAFANACRNGVFATILAHLGMTGPSEVFEGEMGFFKQVAHECFDIPTFGSKEGEPFMIHKTHIKKYPVEYHAQSAVEAAEEIVEQHGIPFEPEAIEQVIIETFGASYEIIGMEPEKWRPTSRETADHSLPYITCAALVEGTVDQETFSEACFTDNRILSLMERTQVLHKHELDKLYPENGIPNKVTVKLRDGRTYEAQVNAPSGHALNPMSDEEVLIKFMRQAEPILRPLQIDAALYRMLHLEEIDNLGEALECLIV